MNIGEAVAACKAGSRIARTGWNGKNMYLTFVPGIGSYLPYLLMRTAQGEHVPWVCSQTDLLAGDWVIVQEDE